MLPVAVARIVVRELLEEFHIRGQCDAYIGSFDEVVTEQPLLRKASAEYFVKGANIVNGLSMVDCFAEQVLIDVGNGLAIRVGTTRVCKQPRETSGCCRWERDADTWLNDGVTASAVAFVLSEFDGI